MVYHNDLLLDLRDHQNFRESEWKKEEEEG